MKSDLLQPIIFGLIPVITLVLFRLLGKLKALKPEAASVQPLDDKEYKKMHQYGAGFVLASMVIVGGVVFLIFRQLADLYFGFIAVHEFSIRLPVVAYSLPAIFLGILLAMYPGEFFMRRIFGNEKYERFVHTADVQRGVNNKKLAKLMHDYGIIICLMTFLYCLWRTSYIEQDSIVVNRFGRLTSQVYPLKDISKILRSKHLRAPNGNIVNRTTYNVVFTDGFVWNIDDEVDYVQFLQAVSQKAGIPIADEEIE